MYCNILDIKTKSQMEYGEKKERSCHQFEMGLMYSWLNPAFFLEDKGG